SKPLPHPRVFALWKHARAYPKDFGERTDCSSPDWDAGAIPQEENPASPTIPQTEHPTPPCHVERFVFVRQALWLVIDPAALIRASDHQVALMPSDTSPRARQRPPHLCRVQEAAKM